MTDSDTRRRIQSADDRALRGRARSPMIEDTIPDEENFDAITDVHALLAKLDVQLAEQAPHMRRFAEALIGEVWQHLNHERRRQRNHSLQIQAAKVPDDLAARLGELEDWRARMVGVDERNGRIGRLSAKVEDVAKDVESLVESKKWITTKALGAVSMAIATAIGAMWWAIDNVSEYRSQQAEIRLRLDHVEREAKEAKDAQREIWRRVFNPRPRGDDQ